MKLQAIGVKKTFVSETGHVNALDGFDLDIPDGQFLCIVGPSGCGKSTLLFIAAGLEKASSGSVQKDGVTVQGPARERGMLFQQFALFPWLTARKNIEFGLEIAGVPPDQRAAASEKWLGIMNLKEFGAAYPHQLSGGMQQRVAIARMLINEPDVLLMDEPFAALDAQTRVQLGEELVRVWQQTRNTVLFVTHSVDEAILLGDRIIVMTQRPGRIKADIAVTIPRPRDTASDEFNIIRRQVTGLIRTEAAAK